MFLNSFGIEAVFLDGRKLLQVCLGSECDHLCVLLRGDLAGRVHLHEGHSALAGNFSSLVRLWSRSRLCVPPVLSKLRWHCDGPASTVRKHTDPWAIRMLASIRLLHSSESVHRSRIRSLSLPRHFVSLDWATRCQVVSRLIQTGLTTQCSQQYNLFTHSLVRLPSSDLYLLR